MHLSSTIFGLVALANETVSLTLSVASSPENASSPLLYGLFFEDIYHSGDGGMYGELIRNRAFQGTQDGNGQTGSPSLTPTTRYWSAVGSGVSFNIDSSTPKLSSALASHMKVSVPRGATGQVGFCNDGYYGFSVDSTKRYIADFYFRGTYTGNMTTYFQSTLNGQRFSAVNTSISQTSAQGWKQYYTDVFNPSSSAPNANNTLCFSFDGSKLAGQSIYVNLISAFKQTFNNRANGLREDLAMALSDMNQAYLRLPGGNNLEGNAPPYFLNWTQTVGPLENRPGFPGTWGSTQTNGLGLVELMQWAEDMNLDVVLGVWGGLYLNGATITQADLSPYVQLALDEMEFLTGDTSTKFGALRAQHGRSAPFKVPYVEIGNEDFLNNGYNSYVNYRFNAFYQALSPRYPNVNYISTVEWTPPSGVAVDLHPYGNESYFKSLFNAFDHKPRSIPLFVAEYAVTNSGNNTGQTGAQTFGMALAEAIFLLGCERNSDVVKGTSYGALIKSYDEAPDTVAVIKQTADEVLLTMSYYVQKLFSTYYGKDGALSVAASGGGFDPYYWAASKSGSRTILKVVSYGGSKSSVAVVVNGSKATGATLVRMSAPSSTRINNLKSRGGESSSITTLQLNSAGGQAGTFSLPFAAGYELAILLVDG
ncbi:glycoside hydrolase family 51 protein [Zasmidium cellare ATCC 36951]|uniref:non-reducing end alpha-L-arabinofuranosidase n=1 Tax=Zasmidium cellare ATCC 36951 TaxID=1080233 RepID=A0A6A6CUM8_ZASCE|nr:glycoside hydrolase family 51 protein [Zasmidium cellare ATCC 36951]KAF2169509.1 glycoside hydrolase family 51 protein [Zasmidium cellare ATCC 36951]